jgi:hypothetical protein
VNRYSSTLCAALLSLAAGVTPGATQQRSFLPDLSAPTDVCAEHFGSTEDRPHCPDEARIARSYPRPESVRSEGAGDRAATANAGSAALTPLRAADPPARERERAQ